MAGATPRFQLIVEAVTRGEAELARLTGVVNKLTADIERGNARVAVSNNKLATEVQTTGASIRQALSNPLDAVIGKLSAGAGGMALFAGAAAGLTVGIGAAGLGLKSFVQEASEAAFEIRELSASTGLTIGAADKLRAVAKLAGFDIRNLQEASLDLSQALKDTSGQGETSRQLLRQLGIAAFDATGKTRPLGDVFTDVFDKLSKVSDLTERVNLSRVLGGEDAAKKSQILISQYAELNQKAADLGFGTRDGLLKSLEDSNKQLRALDLQWEILKANLAEKIAPIIIPVLLNVTKALSGDVQPLLSSPLGTVISPIGSLLSQPLFQNPGRRIRPGEGLSGLYPLADRLLPKQPSNIPDFSTAQILGHEFRAGRAGGEDSLRSGLEQAAKDRAQLRLKLESGDVAPGDSAGLLAELAKVNAKAIELELTLKRIQERRSAIEGLPAQVLTARRSVLKPLEAIEQERADLRSKVGPGSDKSVDTIFDFKRSDEIQKIFKATQSKAAQALGDTAKEAFNGLDDYLSFRNKVFSDGIDAAIKIGEKSQSQDLRMLDILRSSAADRLTRRAGGEVAAFNAGLSPFDERKGIAFEFQTRKTLADTIFNEAVRLAAFEKDAGEKGIALEQARAAFAKESDEAEIERRTRLLGLDRQRKDEARGLASDFVGSLQSGDPGSFFKQQGKRLVNQIGTNALQGTFTRLQSTLGGIGAASGFGGLLKGTLFDPQNAKPIDRVATATERTAAAAETTAAVLTGRSVGGVSLPGAAGLPGFDAIRALGPLGGFTSGFSTKLGQVGAGASSVLAAGGLFAGLRSSSIQTGPGTATTAAGLGLNSSTSRAANVAGSTAFVAGAGISAFRDFRRGGAGNILSGTATVLGTAAALDPEPISKAVLAIAAASAAIIGSMLPDPKQTRDKRINELLNSSMFEESAPTQFNMDRFGRGFDQNKRGQYRDMPPIQINISTMDARSFSDNRELIADAVRMSIYEGHGINRAMQEAVLAS